MGELSQFCQELFFSFSRSDQRRWGEVYVCGLVSVPGRKSVRRISDHIVGWRADQCLQQFVNQSPWPWEPLRCALAQQVATMLLPRAWVMEEVVFPKNGSESVGVAKQYVSSARRMLNCQLGTAMFLASEDGSVPVNWRLMLPRSWDADDRRRARTGVPERERHRHHWEHLLEMVDEMVTDWDLAPVPVLVDARHKQPVEPLLRGLEERGLLYAAQVTEDTPVQAMLGQISGSSATLTAGELATPAKRIGITSLSWRESTGGRVVNSQFVVAALPRPGKLQVVVRHQANRAPRRMLTQWLSRQSRPHAVYLTNINSLRLPDLISLVKLRNQTAKDLTRLQEESGLRHFEGRSFRGWHHHVTLASVAHAYRLLRLSDEQRVSNIQMQPYA